MALKQYSFSAAQLGVTLPLVINAGGATELLSALPVLQQLFGLSPTQMGPNSARPTIIGFKLAMKVTGAGAAVLTWRGTVYNGGLTSTLQSTASPAITAADYDYFISNNNPSVPAATPGGAMQLDISWFLLAAGVRNTLAATSSRQFLGGIFPCDDIQLAVSASAAANATVTAIGLTLILEQ